MTLLYSWGCEECSRFGAGRTKTQRRANENANDAENYSGTTVRCARGHRSSVGQSPPIRFTYSVRPIFTPSATVADTKSPPHHRQLRHRSNAAAAAVDAAATTTTTPTPILSETPKPPPPSQLPSPVRHRRRRATIKIDPGRARKRQTRARHTRSV